MKVWVLLLGLLDTHLIRASMIPSSSSAIKSQISGLTRSSHSHAGQDVVRRAFDNPSVLEESSILRRATRQSPGGSPSVSSSPNPRRNPGEAVGDGTALPFDPVDVSPAEVHAALGLPPPPSHQMIPSVPARQLQGSSASISSSRPSGHLRSSPSNSKATSKTSDGSVTSPIKKPKNVHKRSLVDDSFVRRLYSRAPPMSGGNSPSRSGSISPNSRERRQQSLSQARPAQQSGSRQRLANLHGEASTIPDRSALRSQAFSAQIPGSQSSSRSASPERHTTGISGSTGPRVARGQNRPYSGLGSPFRRLNSDVVPSLQHLPLPSAAEQAEVDRQLASAALRTSSAGGGLRPLILDPPDQRLPLEMSRPPRAPGHVAFNLDHQNGGHGLISSAESTPPATRAPSPRPPSEKSTP